MEQILLRINLPQGKELRSAEFRELLAKHGNFPELFFNYENGRPKSSRPGQGVGSLQVDALPKFCVVGGRGWVGVLAQPGNEELMDVVTGKAIRLVTQQVGAVCKAEISNPEFGCGRQAKPVSYWVREMILKRRHPAAREASVEDLVKERIEAGLVRYATAWGHNLPSNGDMDLRVVQCDRPRGLAIRTTTGTTNEYATLVDVGFTAFVDLWGTWMVGNLTARGYGRIGKFKEVRLTGSGVLE